MFSIGTSERNSILHTSSHNSFVVGASFFFLGNCVAVRFCVLSPLKGDHLLQEIQMLLNWLQLTRQLAVNRRGRGNVWPWLQRCVYFCRLFCCWHTHTRTCTHIDIHTHTRLPLAHINNVRPSSPFFFFFFFFQLYSAKCLQGNCGVLLVRFSID